MIFWEKSVAEIVDRNRRTEVPQREEPVRSYPSVEGYREADLAVLADWSAAPAQREA
jgi:hypothetical protein